MMHRYTHLRALALACITTLSMPVAAYVGPGAGLSLAGALWGLLLAIGTAVSFVLLWPLRRLWRKQRAARAEATTKGAPER
jgi:hypothetical protein